MRDCLGGGRIGHEVIVAAHFPYANGVVQDGVARWCWDVLRALRGRGIDAHGIGCVGGTGVYREIVPNKQMVERMLGQKPKVCVIHTSCKGEELLRACAENGIRSLWVQPNWGLTNGVRSLVELATVTLTPTPEYAEVLREATGRRIEAIPFPIDTNFWCPSEVHRRGGLNIVHASRIGSEKKIHEFVPFYKRYLVDRLPKHSLLFVGPNEIGGGLLRGGIERCGVGETARHIQRHVTDDDMRNLYRAADVFVFPSSRESYGYTPLEAMSCAAPLVTFGSPQVPSMGYFPEYPYSAEPGDWRGFCDNVLKIVEDPDTARETMTKYRGILRSVMGTDAVMPKILRLITEGS